MQTLDALAYADLHCGLPASVINSSKWGRSLGLMGGANRQLTQDDKQWLCGTTYHNNGSYLFLKPVLTSVMWLGGKQKRKGQPYLFTNTGIGLMAFKSVNHTSHSPGDVLVGLSPIGPMTSLSP